MGEGNLPRSFHRTNDERRRRTNDYRPGPAPGWLPVPEARAVTYLIVLLACAAIAHFGKDDPA